MIKPHPPVPKHHRFHGGRSVGSQFRLIIGSPNPFRWDSLHPTKQLGFTPGSACLVGTVRYFVGGEFTNRLRDGLQTAKLISKTQSTRVLHKVTRSAMGSMYLTRPYMRFIFEIFPFQHATVRRAQAGPARIMEHLAMDNLKVPICRGKPTTGDQYVMFQQFSIFLFSHS